MLHNNIQYSCFYYSVIYNSTYNIYIGPVTVHQTLTLVVWLSHDLHQLYTALTYHMTGNSKSSFTHTVQYFHTNAYIHATVKKHHVNTTVDCSLRIQSQRECREKWNQCQNTTLCYCVSLIPRDFSMDTDTM